MNKVHFIKDFPARAGRRFKQEFRMLIRKTMANLFMTYAVQQNNVKCLIRRRFTFMDVNFLRYLADNFQDYPQLVLMQTDSVLQHCFDLLGSGPVVVKRGMQCAGVNHIRYPKDTTTIPDPLGDWLDLIINRMNRSESRRIWRLVDEGYCPIDWQLDFKSGYRWRESTWHGDIRFGYLKGVDIKVPWELARMQHLPTLAMAAHFSNLGLANFKDSQIYAAEFRNQILDFNATNPPGFGVNWVCSMDVAIRVTNWLVARDIFVAANVNFGEDFESIFTSSVKAHARHIMANLEWAPKVRGNHYLANIVGLLFVAVYLSSSKEVNAWLKFSVQELITETQYQFHEDGSNFEGSVCYHRLSSEMVLWGAAFLSNLESDQMKVLKYGKHQKWKTNIPFCYKSIAFYTLPSGYGESPLPSYFWERLRRMAKFSEAMTRPDGAVVQFGDNDSGRFITLGSGEQIRAKNDPELPQWSLDHGSLIEGIHAVTGFNEEAKTANTDVAAKILGKLVGRSVDEEPAHFSKVTSYIVQNHLSNKAIWDAMNARFDNTLTSCKWTSVFEANSEGLLEDIELMAFCGMGCYIAKSSRLYLAIRCGEIGLAGLGAHSHLDQLSIELVVDGISSVRDPGTYCYTAFPDMRNLYRSAFAHHVPRVLNRELTNHDLGVFNLSGAPEGECLYFGHYGFVGCHYGYGTPVYRIVAFENKRIVLKDFSENGLKIVDPTPIPLPYSQAYGRTKSTK